MSVKETNDRRQKTPQAFSIGQWVVDEQGFVPLSPHKARTFDRGWQLFADIAGISRVMVF